MSAGANGLSPSVCAFIERHVDGIDQLEILTLLVDRAPGRLSVEAIVTELRLSTGAALSRLERMHRDGLLSVTNSPPEYAFEPRSPALDAGAREMVTVFRERKVATITEVYSKPSASIRGFADAFRIKGDG